MRKLLLLLMCTLFFCVQTRAQHSVTGTVTDELGEVTGVNVSVKGTTNGTITDVSGKYMIQNVPSNGVLVFSFIGYQTQEVPVAGKKVINVVLKQDTEVLDEVVVVAYGTAKKRDLTGSLSKVDTKAIQAQSASSVTRSLEGSVPGLQVSAVDGQPGWDMGIRVRGLSSTNASSSVALIVIDGVPAQNSNPLSNLSASDIENVTVLKDAASTALYGSRGANGVILITTKKGKSGKPKFSLTTRFGGNYLGGSNVGVVDNAKDYYEYYWKSIYNSYRYGVDGKGQPGTYTAANAPTPDMIGQHYTNIKNPNHTAEEAAQFASAHLFNYVNSETNFERNKLGNWMAYTVPGAVYTPDAVTDVTKRSATMSGAYLIGLDGRLNPKARYLYDSDESFRDQLTRTGFRQEYDLSASGGNEKMDYYMSFGYLSDPSYIINSDFERYNGRVSVNAQMFKWLKVGANVGYTRSNTNQMSTKWGRNAGMASGNMMMYINGMAPTMSPFSRDSNGQLVRDAQGNIVGTAGEGTTYSPLGSVRTNVLGVDLIQDVNESIYKTAVDLWTSRTYADISFLNDFKLTLNYSMDKQSDRLLRYNSKNTSLGSPRGGIGITKNTITIINTQQLLSYNKDINLHHVDAMIGHEYNDYDLDRLQWGSADELIAGFISPGNFTSRYSNVSSLQTPGWYLNGNRMESYLGRVNYIYDNKYFLSGSFRRDGSSKFIKNKWGNFWSVGAGWTFSRESFMESTKDWLDNGKLRVSYGVIGNQNGIGNYTNHTWSYGVATWNQATNGTGVAKTYSIGYGGLVNEELTWETTHTFDVGVDFNLLNNRINGSIDYYNNLTTNSFFNQAVSSLANAGSEKRQRNSAKIRNAGFELELNADIIRTKDFTWNLGMNGTHYTTTLVSVPADQIPAWNETIDRPEGTWESGTDGWSAAGINAHGNTFYLRGEGRDWYQIYMFKYAGVDQNSGLPQYWHRVTYDDTHAKTDGTYANNGRYKNYKQGESVLTNNANEASRYECGSALPAWIGGFTTKLAYKDFDLSAVIAYQLGGKYFSTEHANGLYHEGAYYSNTREAMAEDLIGNTWTPENTGAKFPMQMYGTNYYGGSTFGSWLYTDMSLFSASYMRLKNITLGYNVPKNLLQKVGVSSLRVYATADNLLFFSAEKGIDPSIDITGGWDVGQYIYPTMRSFSIGVNLEF